MTTLPRQTITPSSVGKKTKPLKVLFVSHTYVVGVNQGKLDAIAWLFAPQSRPQFIGKALTYLKAIVSNQQNGYQQPSPDSSLNS